MSSGINVISTQHSKLNHKPIAWLGHNVTMEPTTTYECNAIQMGLPGIRGFAARAMAMEGSSACGLWLVYRRTPLFTAKTK